MPTPLVTVLMAVRDGLPAAADSIHSILVQEFADFEFLIVDDGSTDGTPEYVESIRDPRIRLVRRPPSGLAAALNHGLALARGEWIARQDDDDRSRPGRLARQTAAAKARPDATLVGCDFAFAAPDGTVLREGRPPRSDLMTAWTLLFRNVFSHGAALFPRAAALRVGGYHPLPRSQDYDLWCRLARLGPVTVVPEVLYDWTQDPEGLSGAAGKPLQDAIARAISLRNLRATLRADPPERTLDALRALGNGREREVPADLAIALPALLDRLRRRIEAWRPFPATERRLLAAEVRRRTARLAAVHGGKAPALFPRVLAADPGVARGLAAECLRPLVRPPDVLLFARRKGFWETPLAAERFPHRILLPAEPSRVSLVFAAIRLFLRLRFRPPRVLLAMTTYRVAPWIARWKALGLLPRRTRLVTDHQWPSPRVLVRFDRIVVYSSAEVRAAPEDFRPKHRVLLYPAKLPDPPPAAAEGEYVFSGGYNRRDFATLVGALRGTGIPARIVTRDAKAWAHLDPLPEGVSMQGRISLDEYVKAMAGARFVAVPLLASDRPHGHSEVGIALALGKPVVTTRDATVEDYVEDGREGFLTPPGDVPALRAALLRLHEDGALRARMAAAAREKAKRVTSAAYADAILALCRELGAGRA